jgi:ABC-type dipeptide/oligopeptide/nickel transport system permease component
VTSDTGNFVLRRGAETIVTILVASFFFFALSHMMPGDPIRGLFGIRPPPTELYLSLRSRYGLDDPFVIQYFKYLGNSLRGDFGYALGGTPVREVIATGLPVTLRLTLAAIASQAVIGVVAGVVTTLTRLPLVRSLIRVSTMALLAVPVQVLAYLLQIAGDKLPIFPTVAGYPGWSALALPSLALAAGVTAYVARTVDAELRLVMKEPFVRAAAARGLARRRVVGIHALRVALPPAITLIAASVSQIVTGVILIEAVFFLPGLGYTVLTAARTRDYTLLTGILTLTVFLVIVASFVADVLHAAVDPRVRAGSTRVRGTA